MPEQSWSDPRLTAWFDAVERQWQNQGVPTPDRARLRAEAEADFAQSLADGAHVSDLLATDPTQFAIEVAAADGLPSPSRQAAPEVTIRSLVVTALGGAVLGAILCWVLLYQVIYLLLSAVRLPPGPEGLFALGVHSVAAIFCTLVSVAVVRWRFRRAPNVRRTAALAGIGVLLGGAVGVAPAIYVATTLGYSTSAGLVALVALVVAACCGLGVIASVRLLRGGSPRLAA